MLLLFLLFLYWKVTFLNQSSIRSTAFQVNVFPVFLHAQLYPFLASKLNHPMAAGKIFGAERAPTKHVRRAHGDLGNTCWGWAPPPHVVKGEVRAPRQELVVVMGCHTISLCQGSPVPEVCREGLKPGPLPWVCASGSSLPGFPSPPCSFFSGCSHAKMGAEEHILLSQCMDVMHCLGRDEMFDTWVSQDLEMTSGGGRISVGCGGPAQMELSTGVTAGHKAT